MNKEELIQFLKDNLRIDVTKRSCHGYGGDLDSFVSYRLILCDEVICETYE